MGSCARGGDSSFARGEDSSCVREWYMWIAQQAPELIGWDVIATNQFARLDEYLKGRSGYPSVDSGSKQGEIESERVSRSWRFALTESEDSRKRCMRLKGRGGRLLPQPC